MLNRLGWSALVALALLAACSGDGTGPQAVTRDELVGSFSASTFTTTDSAGTSVDQLSQGASLTLALAADGTVAGRLFVPGGAADGSDFDADLAGTFIFDEGTGRLAFDQTADTFVRNMMFHATRSGAAVRLEAEKAFGPVTIHVVLDQQPAS